MSKENIHNYDRRLERTLERIKISTLSNADKKCLFDFHEDLIVQGLSVAKIERYLYDARRLALMLNSDLRTATKEDIQRIVVEIEKTSWTPQSKITFRILIRKIYRFIEGIDEKGVYPDRVKWIKANLKKSNEKLPEELLTEDEVKNIIRGADTVRDKALIAVLYESGTRISELGLLKIKQVQFDNKGAMININGKTGSRRVRLIVSAPYLQDWISSHPFNADNDSPVWISRENKKPLSYERISYIIKKSSKKVGITKRVNPHNFRHSRATHLARYLTEAQMKQFFGWTQSSDMASIYVHLSSRDVEDTLLKMYGLEEKEEEQKKTSLIKCLRCNTIPKITDKFCPRCGLVLDEEEAKKVIKADLDRQRADDVMNILIQDPEILELIKKKIHPNKSEI